MKRMILVLGMHRSGTSLLTHMLSRVGTYLGESSDLDVANESNKDGYFENIRIRAIHDLMLVEQNTDWADLKCPQIDFHSSGMKKYKDEINKCLDQLFSVSETIGFKDPRIVFFLSAWEKLLKSKGILPVYIYILRKPDEVAQSLYKRDGMPIQYGIQLWKSYNLQFQLFLQDKEYMTLHYDELFEENILDRIGKYINPYQDGRYEKNQMAKKAFRHNDSESLHIQLDDECGDIFNQVMERKLLEKLISIRQDMFLELSNCIKDYELVNNKDFLCEKKVVIYGAGVCGKRAERYLRDLSISDYCFCDKDPKKQGQSINGKEIIDVNALDAKCNILIIVALANHQMVKRIENFFSLKEDVCVCSFFALETLWKTRCFDYKTTEGQIAIYKEWYRQLLNRTTNIADSLDKEIIIYQSGKVGSSSLVKTLANRNIKAAHIHRIYFKKDLVKSIVVGETKEDMLPYLSFCDDDSLINQMRGVYIGKKIITLVREPISVDLSTVFQWIGSGVTDRFFNKCYRMGYSYIDSIVLCMEIIKGRLFDWFREELKVATGVNIFAYPFDKGNGYAVIKEGETEILVLQMEKMDKLCSVISDFVGTKIESIDKSNIGSEKTYSNVYMKTPKDILLNESYINFYYDANPDMEFFYSKQDVDRFKDKWLRLCRQ